MKAFSFVAIVAALFTTATWPASLLGQNDTPLIVDSNSHVVAMLYEAWWGPHAVTFQGTSAKPFLQSKDMQAIGGGYDSADPRVIKQHVEWMEFLGLDATLNDLTNNVSCIFNSVGFIRKYVPNCSPAFRLQNQTIRDNTGNLYPAWTQLNTSLKLIPLLGGIDQNVLFKDIDGKTAFEKEIDYFGALMARYPDRNVIYEDKPLMLIYLGAAQDPIWSDNPLWLQIRKFLRDRPDITAQYKFRMMAGYLDSQPALWENHGVPDGPIEINPSFGFWSVVDRLNPSCILAPFCPYYPTFNSVGSRVENFTASIATAGEFGWGCRDAQTTSYCPDDSLRFSPRGSYTTFAAFMNYAAQLEPIFLFIDQFNEFVSPDEGWNAETNDDLEPADLWGNDLDIVRDQIEAYRQHVNAVER